MSSPDLGLDVLKSQAKAYIATKTFDLGFLEGV